MAIGFGSTSGVGSTDRIVNVTEALPSVYTMSVRFKHNSAGTGLFGRIFGRGSNEGGSVAFNGGATQLYLRQSATTYWVWSVPSPGDWVNMSISMDTTSPANTPVVYVNGVDTTVTQSGADSTFDVSSRIWVVGNREAADRAFDGLLADFAMHDALYTAADHLAFNKGFTPDAIQPNSLIRYLPLIRSPQLDIVREPWTATGTAAQPHPRVISPRRKKIISFSEAAPSTQTLTPTLFVNNNEFFNHVISQPGGTQNLLAPFFTNTNEFYSHTLSPGAVSLQPSLFANSNTFFSHTLALLTNKGVRVTLYNKAEILQANLTGVRVAWFDQSDVGNMVAPVYTTSTATTDASGVLEISVDAVTALSIGQRGFLLVGIPDGATYKLGKFFASEMELINLSA